jgi:hypothetical protein
MADGRIRAHLGYFGTVLYLPQPHRNGLGVTATRL